MVDVYYLIGYPRRVGGIIPSVEHCARAMPPGRFRSFLVHNASYPEEGAGSGRGFEILRHPDLFGDDPVSVRLFLSTLRFVFSGWARSRFKPGVVVHGHSRAGVLACFLLSFFSRARFVVTFHAYWKRRGFYRFFHWKRNLDYVLLTHDMARYYALDPGRGECVVISECCDPRFSGLATRRAELGRVRGTNGLVRFIGLGAIAVRKRWRVIAESLIHLPPGVRDKVRFQLYGWVSSGAESGEYEASLHALIKKHDLGEVFQLAPPEPDVAPLLLGADWYLFPSSMEPCSVALIEAVSSGLPAVVAGNGGSPEIVCEPTAGRVVVPDDPRELAAVIEGIVNGEIVAGAPLEISQTVANRRADAVAMQLSDLYESRLG